MARTSAEVEENGKTPHQNRMDKERMNGKWACTHDYCDYVSNSAPNLRSHVNAASQTTRWHCLRCSMLHCSSVTSSRHRCEPPDWMIGQPVLGRSPVEIPLHHLQTGAVVTPAYVPVAARANYTTVAQTNMGNASQTTVAAPAQTSMATSAQTQGPPIAQTPLAASSQAAGPTQLASVETEDEASEQEAMEQNEVEQEGSEDDWKLDESSPPAEQTSMYPDPSVAASAPGPYYNDGQQLGYYWQR